MELMKSIVSYISKIIADNIQTLFSTSMNEIQLFVLEIFVFLLVSIVSFVLVLCVLIFTFMIIYAILTKFFPRDKNNGQNIFVFIIPSNIILLPILILGSYIKYDSIEPWWVYILVMLIVNAIILPYMLHIFKKGRRENLKRKNGNKIKE